MKLEQVARHGVVGLVVLAVVVILRIKQSESDTSTDERVASLSSVAPVASTALPKLLDLGADKCIPCKKMAPILEALREEFSGQFEVVFIDVWKDTQAAVPYRIKLIPTQIFFDAQGNELFRHEGFFSREDILGKWSELDYVFTPPPEGDAG